MNCKKDDLAIIIRSLAGNEGRLVSVVCPHYNAARRWLPAWRIEPVGGPLNVTPGNFSEHHWLPDAWLRPIRPGDITDTEVADLYAPTPTRTTETV